MVGEIYTEIILDLYKNPMNKGIIEDADLDLEGGNPTCGDQTRIMLKVNNGKIEDVKFQGHGCAISVASESLLMEMIKGKTIEETKNITKEELFEELGNIIETRIKCALLGLTVLKKGLNEYEKNNRKKTIVRNITM